MPKFEYVVVVECATQGQAEEVLAERMDYFEDYGFKYAITYIEAGGQMKCVNCGYFVRRFAGEWTHSTSGVVECFGPDGFLQAFPEYND